MTATTGKEEEEEALGADKQASAVPADKNANCHVSNTEIMVSSVGDGIRKIEIAIKIEIEIEIRMSSSTL